MHNNLSDWQLKVFKEWDTKLQLKLPDLEMRLLLKEYDIAIKKAEDLTIIKNNPLAQLARAKHSKRLCRKFESYMGCWKVTQVVQEVCLLNR